MSPGLGKLALTAVLFSAGLYQCWQFQPAERRVSGDDKLYYFVAERAASGVPPHVSLVDHKHQLASLLEAAAITIGRRLGSDDLLSARYLSIAVAAATVPAIALLALVLAGSAPSGWLAGASMLTFSYFFQEGAIGFRPQLFMAFFMVAGLLAFASGGYLLAGATVAAAFLCWQPSALVGLAMLVALASERRSWGRILQLATGAAVVVLAYEAYFAWHGALGEQLYQSYLMPFGSKGFRLRSVTETLAMIANPLRGGRNRPDMIAGAVLLTVLAAGWLTALVRPRLARDLWARFPRWHVVWLAASAAAAYTFLDYQAYPDRFFLEPFYALTGGAAVGAILAVPRNRAIRTVATTIVVAGLVATAHAVIPTRMTGDVADQRRLGQTLRAMSRERSVWVVGHTELLAFARLDNHTPFGMLRGRGVYQYATRGSNGAPYRPLRDGRMPDVILMSRFGARRHLPWLRIEYERVRKGPLAAVRIGVYRRRGARAE